MYTVDDWTKANNAAGFSVVRGKEQEFGVFMQLCMQRGAHIGDVEAIKSRAHELCVMAAVSGYLSVC